MRFRMKNMAGASPTVLLLTACLALSACGNKGEVEKPATAQTTNAVPGTGAGHSETGATGGSASGGTAAGGGSSSTAAGGMAAGGEAAAVPGATAGGEGRAATEGSAPTPTR